VGLQLAQADASIWRLLARRRHWEPVSKTDLK
jgi:hypothetical protein